MVMACQTVGNTEAKWEEDSPLIWSMQEKIKGDEGEVRNASIDLDLSQLEVGYEMEFLLALKEALINRRHQVSLGSILSNFNVLRALLQICYKNKIVNGKVAQIDSAFLVGLSTIRASIPARYMLTLKQLFEWHRTNTTLFDGTLYPEDFPITTSIKGQSGVRINSILSKALTRAAMVSVLDAVDEAYESNSIDLGIYSFSKLAFNIFCRPESYRQIRIMDLVLDTNKETGEISYFLHVLPAKSRVEGAQRIPFLLHRDVGRILALQVKSVVERFGNTIKNKEDLGKLALFPARGLKRDGTWVAAYAITNFGMLGKSESFSMAYIRPLNKAVGRNMTFNGLRHTIGTQLALMKCSASTIAAVLKHATDDVCQAYVDIVFDGLIDELSDGLQPGFEAHFPAFKAFASKHDSIPRERAIVSEDLGTGRTETIAVCGRQVICQYAPFSCYMCPRFIPCWDADHSINQNIVEQEIRDFEGQGLAMQTQVKKCKHLLNSIRVVAIACDTKSKAMKLEQHGRLRCGSQVDGALEVGT
jgi:integrase